MKIPDAARRDRDYPHQLSGGMKQRVTIAMALICEPAVLIADEPTTALDVTIQAQILDLLSRLREKYRLSVLLITHDLGVVAEMADRVAVMYAGKIVEEARVRDLFREPRHPYAAGLLRSIPRAGAGSAAGPRRLQAIEGTVPDLLAPPPGCLFAPRCPDAFGICAERHQAAGHVVWIIRNDYGGTLTIDEVRFDAAARAAVREEGLEPLAELLMTLPS